MLDDIGARVTFGLGAAGIVAAIVLLVARNDAVAERDRICLALPAATDCALDAKVMAAQSRANTLDTASTAMWIVGGGLAAAGLTWWIVDVVTEGETPQSVHARLDVGPTGGAIVLDGCW